MAKVGIIGGSGLENPISSTIHRKSIVTTRFGDPSSTLTIGTIGGVDTVILSRHDRNHRISPTGVPNRANIQALKDQGCTHIIATTAVGSLREEIGRGDFRGPGPVHRLYPPPGCHCV
jgi:5'-methylthioadenosine phosphorylase